MSGKKSIAISALSLIFSIISTRLVFWEVPNFYSFYLNPIVTIIVLCMTISYYLGFSTLINAIYNIRNEINIKSNKYVCAFTILINISLTAAATGSIYKNVYLFLIGLVTFISSIMLVPRLSNYKEK